MAQNNRFLANAFIYTIGSIFPKAINFILLPIYTRYISPEEYGIVGAMQTINVIALIVFTFGFERGIYRLFHDYKTEQDRQHFFGTVSSSIFIFSTILFAVTFVLSKPIGSIYPSISYYPYYLITFASSYFMTFSFVPLVYFQVIQAPQRFLLFSLAQVCTKIISTVILVIIMRRGGVGFLLGDLIGNVILAPVFLLIIIRLGRFSFRLSIFKSSLSYCLPFIPSLLSAWVMNLSARIFIERHFTLADLGVYAISTKLSEVLLVVGAGLSKAYNPLFFKLANSKEQNSIQKISNVNFLFVAVIVFLSYGLMFWAEDLFRILFSKEYQYGAKIFPFLVLGLLFNVIAGIFNNQIYQVKKSMLMAVLMITGAIINIGLNMYLIPRAGLLGAAYSKILTSAFLLLVVYSMAQKYFYVSVKFKRLGIFTAVLVSGLLLWAMLSDNVSNVAIYKSLIFVGTSAIVVYLQKDFVQYYSKESTEANVEMSNDDERKNACEEI